MGFTIEDMLTVSQKKYGMQILAGRQGWSNSIGWILRLEEMHMIRDFSGRELAVTTGMKMQSESRLTELAEHLHQAGASGLLICLGSPLREVPRTLVSYCEENGFPLLTIPADVHMTDMIKDLSMRVYLQDSTDEQIAAAFIRVLEKPEMISRSREELASYFDIEGPFRAIVIDAGGIRDLTGAERRQLIHRIQIALTDLTHGCHLMFYDSCLLLILNHADWEASDAQLHELARLVGDIHPEEKIRIGAGTCLKGLEGFRLSWTRAVAAVRMAADFEQEYIRFDDMGTYRILYMVRDYGLLTQFSEELLAPLEAYDKRHHANYIETLENYLTSDDSIQAVAKKMYTHRNTILYRIRNIKKMLGTELSTMEEKMTYLTACRIRHMDGAEKQESCS